MSQAVGDVHTDLEMMMKRVNIHDGSSRSNKSHELHILRVTSTLIKHSCFHQLRRTSTVLLNQAKSTFKRASSFDANQGLIQVYSNYCHFHFMDLQNANTSPLMKPHVES